MLTVFTKETARGKFRQFLKLIMLLFAVQFFLPVLLEPMFIFSIYSVDNDDNFHLHIAFHLESSLSLSHTHKISLSATFCMATENANCIITIIGQWGEEKPQSKYWKKGGWKKGRMGRRKHYTLPCLLKKRGVWLQKQGFSGKHACTFVGINSTVEWVA